MDRCMFQFGLCLRDHVGCCGCFLGEVRLGEVGLGEVMKVIEVGSQGCW